MSTQPEPPTPVMSSVIRIKRKVGDDPQQSLLATKRRRLDSGGTASASAAPPENTLLQFVGTMTAEDTALPEAALNAMRAERKSGAARRDPLTVAAAIKRAKEVRRARLQDEQKARRFRIVSRRRGEPGADAADAGLAGLPGVIDVEEEAPPATSAASSKAAGSAGASGAAPEEQLTCNGQVLERVAAPDASAGFVYDLYVTNAPLADDDDLLELRPCDDVLLWEHRAARHSESDDPFADDDDSNDEDNWRNDYPEELGDSDYDRDLDPSARAEFDLIRRMETHEICADGEDDAPLAYGLDELETEAGGDDPYERYKARMLRELAGEDSDSEGDGGYLAGSGDDSGDDD